MEVPPLKVHRQAPQPFAHSKVVPADTAARRDKLARRAHTHDDFLVPVGTLRTVNDLTNLREALTPTTFSLVSRGT